MTVFSEIQSDMRNAIISACYLVEYSHHCTPVVIEYTANISARVEMGDLVCALASVPGTGPPFKPVVSRTDMSADRADPIIDSAVDASPVMDKPGWKHALKERADSDTVSCVYVAGPPEGFTLTLSNTWEASNLQAFEHGGLCDWVKA